MSLRTAVFKGWERNLVRDKENAAFMECSELDSYILCLSGIAMIKQTHFFFLEED